jgi:signal transduction histidine kinase
MAKILIVDDDYMSIEQVQKLLSNLGHETVFTLHPEHIFTILSEESADLILLDIYMPEVNGVELLKQIQTHPRFSEIPVIMLTSDQDEKLLYECFHCGAADFINKPYNEVILSARINSALKVKNTIDQLKKFVGIVSHDIRNPLSVIQGYSQIIPRNESNDRMLSHIETAANRCLDLVKDILDMMAVESGKIQINKGCYKVKHLFESSSFTSQPMLNKKNITLTILCDDQIAISVDKNRIIQVLDNLLGNAIKFSHPGTEIIFECKSIDDMARLSVKDSGIGIAPERIEQLFMKHKKTSTAGTQGEKGTGFGLPLSQELMKAHNSKINVTSKEGESTTFYFDLPQCKCEKCNS